MRKLAIIVVVFSCLVASCKNKVKTVVTGWWTIDTIYYQNYEIKTCLLGNDFWFNKDGTVRLPIPEDRCSELVTEFNERGSWKVFLDDSKTLLLTIESKNNIFNGTHHIVFKRDNRNSLLFMEIISDNLYVLCRKGMFNYNQNQGLINELEKMSSGNPLKWSFPTLDNGTTKYNNVQDDNLFLQTGWYYVADTGVGRQLKKTSETYMINPEPIVTSNSILHSEVYKRNPSEELFNLNMQFDKEGTKKWSIATEKATSKRLAFIVDNVIVQVFVVNGRIDNGISVLNGYTKIELDSLKTMMLRGR